MPRLSLTSTKDCFYHVVLHVNRREALADTAKDRRILNEIAIDTMRRFDVRLHAYCLMDNHLRALVQINIRTLAKTLRHVATRYSRYRRRNLKSAEHLFERPYKAQRVESEADFLRLLRLIHLNPVIANKVVVPDDYPWSSHRAYVGYKSNALITTTLGLSLLAEDPARARTAYNQFIKDGMVALAENAAPADDSHAAAETSLAAPLASGPLPAEATNPSALSSGEHSSKRSSRWLRFNRRRARQRSRQYLSFY